MVKSLTTSALMGVFRLLFAEVLKRTMTEVPRLKGTAKDRPVNKHPIRNKTIIFFIIESHNLIIRLWLEKMIIR